MVRFLSYPDIVLLYLHDVVDAHNCIRSLHDEYTGVDLFVICCLYFTSSLQVRGDPPRASQFACSYVPEVIILGGNRGMVRL